MDELQEQFKKALNGLLDLAKTEKKCIRIQRD